MLIFKWFFSSIIQNIMRAVIFGIKHTRIEYFVRPLFFCIKYIPRQKYSQTLVQIRIINDQSMMIFPVYKLLGARSRKRVNGSYWILRSQISRSPMGFRQNSLKNASKSSSQRYEKWQQYKRSIITPCLFNMYSKLRVIRTNFLIKFTKTNAFFSA